jgi:hypothetical protein
VVTTKRVRYTGEATVELPTLGVVVEHGAELDVDDDFANANFVDVVVAKKTKITKEEA